MTHLLHTQYAQHSFAKPTRMLNQLQSSLSLCVSENRIRRTLTVSERNILWTPFSLAEETVVLYLELAFCD